MRLTLDNLGSAGLELELAPVEDQPRKLRLDHAHDLAGAVVTEEGRTRLAAISGREVTVSSGTWVFGFGTTTIEKPAELQGVELDLEIGGEPGFAGVIAAALLDAAGLALDFGSVRVSGDLRVERLRIEHGAEGDGQAAAAQVAARNLQLTAGGVLVRTGAVAIENLLVRWGSGSWTVAAGGATIAQANVSLAGIEIHLGQTEIPRGFTVSADEIRCPDIGIGEARVEIDDLRSFLSGDRKSEGATLDLRLLDRLNGRLDVDLTLDATVPVIGRRKATHHFRIPIHDGTINYRQLERDLSLLEDAVIDFKVRGSRLVLERNLILPGMNKPILIWDLSEVELALAKERIVRLRTVPGFRLPGAGQPSDEKSSRFALRRADFDNIDLAVSLDQPRQGAPLEGWIRQVSAEALTAQGGMHYDASREDETTLRLAGRAIALSLANLPASAYLLSIDGLELGALEEGTLEFRGVKPGRLAALARETRGRGVKLARAEQAVVD